MLDEAAGVDVASVPECNTGFWVPTRGGSGDERAQIVDVLTPLWLCFYYGVQCLRVKFEIFAENKTFHTKKRDF